jgi:hypothetical protein
MSPREPSSVPTPSRELDRARKRVYAMALARAVAVGLIGVELGLQLARPSCRARRPERSSGPGSPDARPRRWR